MSEKASFFLMVTLLVCARTVPFVAAEETCTVGADGFQECHTHPIPPTEKNSSQHQAVVNQPPDCIDDYENCVSLARAGRCESNPEYMMRNCARSCNSCTEIYGEKQTILNRATATVIREMQSYMTETVYTSKTYAKVKSECKNRHKDCVHCAANFECEKNPAFMTV